MVTERKYWLDDPRNVNKLFYALCIICGLLALLDVGGILYDKHPHYAFERLWNFYGLFGFVSYCLLVFLSKLLRKLVMRKEDFYD